MAKRRKRPPKSAYLKRSRSFYDPNSPYALKTRGQKAINISGLIRDPKTKELYDAGTPPTITHGKRGLTIARAEGPTAVAIHKVTDDVEYQHNKTATKSTMIPLAARIKKQVEAIEALEIDPRGKIREWNHVSIYKIPGIYTLELFFEGQKWVYVERDHTRHLEQWSMTYGSRDRAKLARRLNRIRWVEQFPIPAPDPPSGISSVPAPV